ncbi:putative bifunctional diguanylate cyclase/phosphodiesterase [Sedimenticola sp.]|uniref:putative bifunctional diguanylate cyclase/phosphodiesterase n=1 Tax=Sedimenticola sp. TaxID=1940285 RepID=UPI003D09CFEC
MTLSITDISSRQVGEVRDINRELLEKSLRMSCLAYLHQVKSDLLVETIHDFSSSKQQLARLMESLRERTREAEQQRQLIARQKQLLSEHNAALLADRNHLELKVLERTEALDRLAHYDALTNLPNRFLFNDRLRHALARASRDNYRVCVLLIDLDRFKNINDTAGHPAGDELLRQVAARLREYAREEDTVARLGGDEFALIMENFEQDELPATVADKIQRNLLLPFLVDDAEIFLTASIGISLFPDDANDAVALLKNADSAMYRAKAEGKNKYHYYTRELTVAANSRFSLEKELRQALERGEFELYFQPQFKLSSGELSGAEALIRWNHPVNGLVSPAEFIWLAEETGLIKPISVWVLRRACQQAKVWFDNGTLCGRISVNFSAHLFIQENVLRMIRQILDETGLPPEYLEIEITESALMGQRESISQLVQSFREAGVTLAIDDFGTGYCSLAYLKRFHVEKLKIDRSFVRDVPEDGNDVAIVLAIIAMAHSLGLSVIAEGVETEAQAALLADMGCDAVQGFLYGKPVPAAQFQQFS